MAGVDPMASDPVIDAAFARLLESKAPELTAAAHALRASIKAAMPDAVEQIDFADGLLALGRSRAMGDLLFAIIPHTAHVNLQLVDGADLPNPDGAIEGTGKRARHIKIRSAEAADSPAVRAAIAAQITHGR
jgi:hypothetical protein